MSREFVEYLCECLTPFGKPRSKRMFGGWGLYLDGDFIAIVTDGELYWKGNADSRALFLAAGGRPFRYSRSDGRVIEMAYFTLPELDLEASENLDIWVRRARSAARQTPKKHKTVPPKPD